MDGAIDLDDIIANIDACEIKVTAGCKPMTVRQTTQIALEARRRIFLSSSQYDSENDNKSDDEIVMQQSRMQEHLEYLQNLPARIKRRVKAEVRKANEEMSQRVMCHEGIRNTCDQCDYKATTKGDLRRHLESIHEGARYTCDQCDYKPTTKGDLKRHVESIHEGVRYTCDQCDYKPTTKGGLKRHVESIHDGVRHTCDQCDYKATTKGDLKRHVESIHEGVRYTCDQCDYKATTKGENSTTRGKTSTMYQQFKPRGHGRCMSRGYLASAARRRKQHHQGKIVHYVPAVRPKGPREMYVKGLSRQYRLEEKNSTTRGSHHSGDNWRDVTTAKFNIQSRWAVSQIP